MKRMAHNPKSGSGFVLRLSDRRSSRSSEVLNDAWGPSNEQETQLQRRRGPTPHDNAAGYLAEIAAAAVRRRERKKKE
jgi:hypothetical protein